MYQFDAKEWLNIVNKPCGWRISKLIIIALFAYMPVPHEGVDNDKKISVFT